MIVDLRKFIKNEEECWNELESVLDRIEKNPLDRMSVAEARRFHYLYERVSSDLSKFATFAVEQGTRRYLESLVARAYGEIHEIRETPHKFRPIHWFLTVFPQTFRTHLKAFNVSLAVTLVGCLFGGFIVTLDPSAKEIILPYQHLLQHPSQRVANEEKSLARDRLEGRKAQGAAWYIQNNTRVSIITMAMGVTWGIGTLIMLLSNGIILGAVIMDYILAGETTFLAGWLLPHGSFEIPAILLAGQAGFVLAAAVIGWGKRIPMRDRLRLVSGDLMTLIGGVAVLLVWAGIIESFLSQYHAPVLPYWLKIAFGVLQFSMLVLLLCRSGKHAKSEVETKEI
jgi:uncharacterized membrane protein SpoIIM required for sporulation